MKGACVKEWLNPTKQAWLNTVRSFQKKRKSSKELAKSNTWKSGLGNRERPGGLKTRNGDLLSTMRPSPRKFAECVVLQCHSVSHLTCFVSFHRVHPSYATTQLYSHLQFIQSSKSHSFIHSYNYTFIHQYFHTLMHTQHINNINPYMVASVARILFRPYLFKSVFTYHCIKAPSPNNRTTCIYLLLLSYAKWPVLNNGQLEFIFRRFQTASPNGPFEFVLFQAASLNGPFEFTFYILFQAASPNGQLEFIFYLISSGQS